MQYLDLHKLSENDRIEQIGKAAMSAGNPVVAFVVDSDAHFPGKADRYINKLLFRFPEVRVVGRFDGPTAGVVTVKVCRTNNPPVLVNVQSVEQCAKRFPKAIEKLWDITDIEEDGEMGDRPGLHAENVFDVEDGVTQFRFIMSYDRRDENKFFHVSMSIIKHDGPTVKAEEARKKIRELIERICGRTLPEPSGEVTSEGGILHWFWQPLTD
jgi:hypothetical protein